MIDKDGYRANVGIVLLNKDNLVFWGRRKGESSWQFPQGGITENETTTECMFRELHEEIGILAQHVKIIAKTEDWLYYDVPSTWTKSGKQHTNYRGQKQIWYLLRLISAEHHINVRSHTEQEFDAWRWISYWEPIDLVVKFKQDVYKKVLNYFCVYVNGLPANEG